MSCPPLLLVIRLATLRLILSRHRLSARPKIIYSPGACSKLTILTSPSLKQEAKMIYLLECLQKTAPPVLIHEEGDHMSSLSLSPHPDPCAHSRLRQVLIFAESKQETDDIHEYLMLKGVEAVAIHGGKDQAEREFAIGMFKEGKKDVLIGTDVASKGLDFPEIQHVINFDMPKEIENYVHRIGRTGRCGKTGVATTFINKNCDETILLDLKHLLIEARQRIPPVLATLEDPNDAGGQGDEAELAKGCAFCGGLGHRVTTCPKLEAHRMKQMMGTGGGGELAGTAGNRSSGNDW